MDHRNKRKVLDPVVKDLFSKKYRTTCDKKHGISHGRETTYILKSNISKGRAFLLQGITKNDSKGKKTF